MSRRRRCPSGVVTEGRPDGGGRLCIWGLIGWGGQRLEVRVCVWFRVKNGEERHRNRLYILSGLSVHESPLVKEKNEMLRPMWCCVFFRGPLLNEIPKSLELFFSLKKIITFLSGAPPSNIFCL